MKILSHTSAKKKTERLKGFRFRTFIGRFSSSDIMAVKGLKQQQKHHHHNHPVTSSTILLVSEPEWEDWAQWSVCSKTCGKGFRTRLRVCTVAGVASAKCSGRDADNKGCFTVCKVRGMLTQEG